MRKLRMGGVISSFQNCRSKDPSTLPVVPSTSSSTALHSSIKRHVSSAITSVGCGCASASSAASSHSHSSRHPTKHAFQWEEDDQWLVVANINQIGPSENSAATVDPKLPTRTKRRVRKNKTTTRSIIRISTSSAGSGIFSDNDNNIETEALVSSSRTFSTGDDEYSSSFNPQLETIREADSRRKMKRRRRRRRRKKGGGGGEEVGSPARLSRFQKWVMPGCRVAGGKVRESYAVVKKSEDPKEDFKRSMAEMIMEKEMYEEDDLEELLQCFLSLNLKAHHGVIIQAFSEIWQDLFST